MWFNKLPCNISTIPGSSASYLQLRSSSSRHPQRCWVLWHTLYVKTWSCEVWWTSQSRKPTTVNFDLGISGLAPLPHLQNLFFINFRDAVCAYKFIFELTIYCWVYTWFRFAIWLVLPGRSAGSRQLFPQMLPGSLLPPFLRREHGDEARCK